MNDRLNPGSSTIERLLVSGASDRADGVVAWRFAGFEFDLRRSELRGPGAVVIALRPKSDLLLRHFLAQPGRLLSKDELVAVLWPQAMVTDDSLVQCVGELRDALGDDAKQLIRTVSRRGYRLEAAVEAVLAVPADRDANAPEPAPGGSAAPSISTSATGHDAAGAPQGMPRVAGGFRRSWWWIGASVGAAMGGVALLLFMASRPAPIHIDEAVLARYTIAVMPLVAPPDNPAMAATANALADRIAAQIAGRYNMRSVRPEAIGAGNELVRASSRRSQPVAPYVLSGRLTQRSAQGEMGIDLQTVAVVTGAVIWSGQFQSPSDGDPASLDGIAMVVVNQLRASIGEVNVEQITRPGHVPDAAELVILGWHELLQRRSMDDLHRGRARFRQALEADPTSVTALLGVAASYTMARTRRKPWTAQEWAEAERHIELANRLAPDNSTSAQLWGDLQLAKGRADLALPAFDRSIRADPSFVNGYLQRARALLLLGRTDEVQAEIDLGLPLGIANRDWPRVSRAYVLAAEAALMRGEDDRAYEFARKAVSARPSEAVPHVLMAAIDALAGRKELAATEMAAFRELWPEATVAHFDDYYPSNNPTFLAQRQRLYDGLRKAGLPAQ